MREVCVFFCYSHLFHSGLLSQQACGRSRNKSGLVSVQFNYCALQKIRDILISYGVKTLLHLFKIKMDLLEFSIF